MKYKFLSIIALMLLNVGCGQSQNNQKMKETNNPLLCDPTKGICELPEVQNKTNIDNLTKVENKPIKIIYYTDPICSSCWGIEPQLRKLKLEYGDFFEIEYKMGGLLPDWSYNSGGISKPSDVAHHWDEVSQYYDMPIDGDIWLEDPLPSSYPPSVAFKAAQMQDNEKAILFLREIREMVFLKKKNITKWDNLEQAAYTVGLNVFQFKKDYQESATALFKEDLKLSKELGVRGFPTMLFIDSEGKSEMIYGYKPYAEFENLIFKLYPKAIKNHYSKKWTALFLKYNTLTLKEYSELTETPRKEGLNELEDLTKKGILEKVTTKNGSIWKINKDKILRPLEK